MEKYQKDFDYSYCLGMSLTMEALLQKPDFVKEVILSEKAYKNSQLDHLLDLCEKHIIKIVYDDKTIDKLSIKENCYCIGVFDKFYFKPEGRRHIVLYGFNDYGELGTVLRSSIAFDFHDIILVSSQIDYFDPRCIRASMGSIFHTNISQYEDLNSYLEAHKGYEIYPFVSKSDRKLSTLELHDPYAIVISQDPDMLDGLFDNGISIEQNTEKKMSLSIRSSIILSYAYDRNRRR